MTKHLRQFLLIVFAWLAAIAPLQAGKSDRRLDLYWIDVEGGAATLIVTPAGESVLIDAGNPGARDPGRIHKTVTTVAKLKQIDHYITTHFHSDHFGGAAELAALMPIVNIHDNGIPAGHPDGRPNDPRWPLLIKPYSEIKAPRHVVEPGHAIPLSQSKRDLPLSLRCVAAKQQFIPAPANAAPNPLAEKVRVKEIPPTDNDNSNAWVLEFGAFRFFDAGDLTWNMEAQLVAPVNRVGQVDVYQTTHHGRDDSNNTVLIHSLAPTVAVMNNGITKGTMKECVAGLRTSPGIRAIYQVHKNLRPDDPENNTFDECIANFASEAASCPGHYIKLSVAPDGKSYTVSIPASGYARTFETRSK